MAKRAASADPSKILKDLSQYQITRDAAQFSELEERILKTYDELEELRIDRMMWELSNQVPRGMLTLVVPVFGPRMKKLIRMF